MANIVRLPVTAILQC